MKLEPLTPLIMPDLRHATEAAQKFSEQTSSKVIRLDNLKHATESVQKFSEEMFLKEELQT